MSNKDFKVYQKDFNWYVKFKNNIHPFVGDIIILNSYPEVNNE